jgi:hypothetical protein
LIFEIRNKPLWANVSEGDRSRDTSNAADDDPTNGVQIKRPMAAVPAANVDHVEPPLNESWIVTVSHVPMLVLYLMVKGTPTDTGELAVGAVMASVAEPEKDWDTTKVLPATVKVHWRAATVLPQEIGNDMFPSPATTAIRTQGQFAVAVHGQRASLATTVIVTWPAEDSTVVVVAAGAVVVVAVKVLLLLVVEPEEVVPAMSTKKPETVQPCGGGGEWATKERGGFNSPVGGQVVHCAGHEATKPFRVTVQALSVGE